MESIERRDIYYPEKRNSVHPEPFSATSISPKNTVSNWEMRKQETQEFADSTTLHGVRHWMRSDNPTRDESQMTRRIAYFAVWTIMTGIMVFQLQANLRHYLKYETKVSLEFGIADSLTFPSITLCPESTFKKSKVGGHLVGLGQFMKLYHYSDYRSMDQCLDTSIENADRFNTTQKIIEYWTKYKERDGAREIAMSIEDLFLKCSFRMKEFDCDESWFAHFTEVGLCFTFNYANQLNRSRRNPLWFSKNYKSELKRVKGSGILSSLKLLLSVEKNESCLLVSGSTNGFYMNIHDQNSIPTAFVLQKSILIGPGTRTQVTVQENRRDSSRIENLGRCATNFSLYLYPDTPYIKQNCIIQCITEDIWKECSCVNIYMTTDVETTGAGLNNSYFPIVGKKFLSCYFGSRYACMWKVIEKYHREGNSRCNNFCPEACYETKYDLQISAVRYPSAQIVDHVINTTKFKSTKEIEENLLAVDIFFESMEYRHIIETRAVTPGDMFSNVGGTLGLYLGASLLTLIEVLEFIVIWVTGCKNNKK